MGVHLGQQGLATPGRTGQQYSWRALETQTGKLCWIAYWSLDNEEEEEEEEEKKACWNIVYIEGGLTSIAMESSSLTAVRAPTSSHVVSGTVAKPSRLEDGCTRDRAT